MTIITINILYEPLSVHQLPPNSEIPMETLREKWLSIKRTGDEVSLVLPSAAVIASAHREDGWIALQVDGVLDLGLVGILAGISSVLAHAHISIFAISTFNTDYVLIKRDKLDEAAEALRSANYTVNL